jgi:hypothetical protein
MKKDVDRFNALWRAMQACEADSRFIKCTTEAHEAVAAGIEEVAAELAELLRSRTFEGE